MILVENISSAVRKCCVAGVKKEVFSQGQSITANLKGFKAITKLRGMLILGIAK